MKRRYNTFEAANWLLAEDEDEETKTEIAEQDPEEDEETEETEETEESNEIEDSDTDEDDSLVDANDLNSDDTDIEGRLDTIENKLDDLLDQKATSEGDEEEFYDLDLSNPVCPHCGARLDIVDDTAETNDIDDQIIDGDFDDSTDGSEDLDDEASDETTGEEITVMDDNQDTTQDINIGNDDYVNFDDIMSSINDEDEEEK